jgi:DNA-binding CsgD family transcriptional regulator/tetratricopeptide (TPR) repeat protein
MAERAAPGTAAELARHARAANDLPTATRASIEAGDEAMELAAPAEAARHYEAALELLADDRSDAEAHAGVGTVELVVRAADALSASGDVFRAVALVQDALGRLPVAAPAEQRAGLLLALARAALYEEANAGIDVASLTTEALTLVPADPATPLRARVVNMHARAASDLRRDDEAARWAREAADLARSLHLPDVGADAATTLAQLEQRAGDPEAARQQLEETIAAARAGDQLSVELRSLYHLGGLHYELGRLAEARSAYEHAMRRAAETGRQWAPYGLDSRAMAGIAAHVAGDWEATLDMVDVRGQSPPDFAEAILTAVGLSVSAGRGEIGAIERLGELRPWWDRDGMMAILAAGAGIDLHGDRGDLDAARSLHDEAVRHVSELWQQPWFQARLRLGALLIGQIGNAAARSPTAAQAALASLADEVYVGVGQTADAGIRSGHRRGPEGTAWIARAAAEHARVRWLTGVDAPAAGDLVRLWEEAGKAFETFPHVFERARSRARLASALRALGRTRESAEQVDLAWADAERLAARPLLEELRATGAGRAAHERLVTRVGGGLTAREREVLALLAEGRSNREIAGHLFITAKTASVHVSNIMAKLGAASRTEAVAVARRHDLLADTAAGRP